MRWFPAARREDRVLVVDEDPPSLDRLGAAFEQAGYRHIELVADPGLAAPACRARCPDLVVLDLHPAREGGFQVLDQLRSQGPFAPVLGLVAPDEPWFRLRALRSGARDLVSKPVHAEELMARAANLIESDQMQAALRRQNERLERMVLERTSELRCTQREMVRRLGRVGELRDTETGQHVVRIGIASRILAQAIGWDADSCALIEDAATLHDLGKIGIPDEILLKPGPLTASERKVMERHALIGGEILDGVDTPLLVMARDIALAHHERWDGAGYPSGLTGRRIPRAARIVTVTDVFDALMSRRPYKPAWPAEEAVRYLVANRELHFDPELVDAWCSVLPQVLALWQCHPDVADCG